MFAVLALGVLLIWELLSPAKRLSGRGAARALNATVGILNVVLLRLVLPLGLATWAAIGTTQLGRPGVPLWLGLLLLDLALYVQHWACHRYRPLWRMHAPHHSDSELDVTTGLRFHPLEALASGLWKGAVIVAVGIDAGTVLVFEALLGAASCFSHANIAWRGRLARVLDLVWMTPAVHRVHHGLDRTDQTRNLAFGMTVWDWLFGTRASPREIHHVGLTGLNGAEPEKPGKFALLPFQIRSL